MSTLKLHDDFFGTGNRRSLKLGADGKAFMEIHPDGVIQGMNGAEFNGIAILGAELESPFIDSATLETPEFATSPSGYGITQFADVLITKDDILAMNATPVTVVAGVAGEIVEFCGAVLIFTYAGNTYGGGGDVTLQSGSAGATISNTIAKANAFGAGGDKIYSLVPLNAAGGFSIGNNSGIAITNATGAFTDPGGPAATGTARLLISFRRWLSSV